MRDSLQRLISADEQPESVCLWQTQRQDDPDRLRLGRNLQRRRYVEAPVVRRNFVYAYNHCSNALDGTRSWPPDCKLYRQRRTGLGGFHEACTNKCVCATPNTASIPLTVAVFGFFTCSLPSLRYVVIVMPFVFKLCDLNPIF